MSQPTPPKTLAPYPELIPVHHAAAAGDWAGVLSAYAALTTWSMRGAAIGVVGDAAGAEAMLTPIAEGAGDTPEQLLARTMLADRLISIGWEIRSSKRATEVSADQFRQLHEYLRRSERLLIDIVARQPDNVAAWSLRLTTALGLQLGQSEARRRYDHAARYEPHHLAAQGRLLQQLCPKWSGSLDQMHAFARECAHAAPPGSINGVLIVEAHLEHWQTLTGPESGAYLLAPEVQHEVAVAAGQSVLHPAFRPDYGWVDAHGYFALYQCLVENLDAAAVHFRAVGPFDPSSPWTYHFRDPETMYQKNRAAALARG